MFTEKQQPPTMNSQQEQQIEKLKELGSQIRKVREEKSVSIDEVATKTRIQARLLVAIEEGNLESLPEPVYIKGLIKQFAETLGLNGTEYARAFPTGSQTYTLKPSWREAPSIQFGQLRPLHLYVFYFLVVIASVSGISFLVTQRTSDSDQGNVEEQVVEEAEPTEPTDTQLATTTGSSSEETQDSTQSPESPVVVNISIEAEAWVRVMGDGEQLYEGVLSAGENRNWTAEEEITIRTGNAGGVIVEYNDHSPLALGEAGEVTEVTYSP